MPVSRDMEIFVLTTTTTTTRPITLPPAHARGVLTVGQQSISNQVASGAENGVSYRTSSKNSALQVFGALYHNTPVGGIPGALVVNNTLFYYTHHN